MVEKRTEDMIHEALEGGRGITQAKGHEQKLIVAKVDELMAFCDKLENERETNLKTHQL